MAGPAGHVAEEVVLDERELLGEECHLVCCAYQKQPGRIVTICGLPLAGGTLSMEDLPVTCVPCVETEATEQRCRTTPYCYEWFGENKGVS